MYLSYIIFKFIQRMVQGWCKRKGCRHLDKVARGNYVSMKFLLTCQTPALLFYRFLVIFSVWSVRIWILIKVHSVKCEFEWIIVSNVNYLDVFFSILVPVKIFYYCLLWRNYNVIVFLYYYRKALTISLLVPLYPIETTMKL